MGRIGRLLSFNTRKSLCVQLGEPAGKELADALELLASRLEGVQQEPDVPSPASEPDRPSQEILRAG